MTTNKYDSLAEEAFHLKHPNLISLHADYPAVFKDDTGFLFNARSDFYDRSTKTYIEFKSHQLNTKATHAIAWEKWLAQQPYLTSSNKTLKMCENQWCHSMVKQSIVQRTLAKQDIKMIIVFKDGTRITTNNSNRMKLLNLNWKYESDYFAN